MAQLDICWFGAFIEIYRTHSISLAAERLQMAQARVSGTLGKLRRHFGDPLFVRTAQGMQPTPYADRIYPDVQSCFERLSCPEYHRNDFNPLTAKRQFRICMTDISEIVVLPQLIVEVRRLAAGVEIADESISVHSSNRMKSGEVDLALGYMPSLEAGFYQQTLFRQGFVCLVSRRHPRIQKSLTLKMFANESHLVVTTSGTGHTIVDREFAKRGIKRKVALRVSSFLGVARLVAETELLAIVPRRLAEALADPENVKMFAPPIPLPSYAVKLLWHARYHADPGNVWLRKVIARVLRD